MRSCWRAFITAHQILICLMLQLLFVAVSPAEGLCKGGTNLHEPLPLYETAVPVHHATFQTEDLSRCGRGQYPNHRGQKCHFPVVFHH